jgi:hypothetical protein
MLRKSRKENVHLIKNELLPKILNVKTLVIVFVFVFIFFRFKNIFFVLMFIAINLSLIYLQNMGVFNPIKIAEFGTFMCAYAFSPVEGIAVAVSALASSILFGRAGFYKSAINLLLIGFALLIPTLRIFPVYTAGIIFAVTRTFTDLLINTLVFRDFGSMNKNMKRALDLVFWIFVYSAFGEGIYILMK